MQINTSNVCNKMFNQGTSDTEGSTVISTVQFTEHSIIILHFTDYICHTYIVCRPNIFSLFKAQFLAKSNLNI